MKRIIAAVGLALLLGCGGINPPPLDCRTLGCEPGNVCEEQPDGSWRCVPVVPDVPPMSMLLRANGGQLVDFNGAPIDFLGAIPCCRPLEVSGVPQPMAFTVEGETKHTGWPIALHPDWRAYVEQKTGGKGNFYHARLGPWFASATAEPEWIDVGGPYVVVNGKADLEQFNPGYWDRVRKWVIDAGLNGSWVEIDLNDRWWAKQSPDHRANPMQAEWNVQAYDWKHQVGRAEIVPGSYIDRWLEKIILTLGDLSNVIWEDGNEVGLGGYGVEWTRSMKERIRHWEATHANNVVHLFGTNSKRDEAERIVDYIERHQGEAIPSPIHNRPSLVNEYNPSPPFSPAKMVEKFCRAKATGTYWWYWRHTQTMDAMSATLGAYGKGECSTPPPPPPPQNGACPSEADLTGVDDRSPMYHDEVLKATRELGDLTGNSCRSNLDKLAEQLRKQLGQCVISGKEAVFIVRPDKTWEENHTCYFGDGSWTNSGRGKYKGVHTSGPMPDGLLPDPRAFDEHAKYSLKKHNNKWDRTFNLTRVLEYCRSIGMGTHGNQPRASCPVRPEGNDFRVWWEQLYGYYWECDGVQIEPTANPSQAVCHGHVKTCNAAKTICAEASW